MRQHSFTPLIDWFVPIEGGGKSQIFDICNYVNQWLHHVHEWPAINPCKIEITSKMTGYSLVKTILKPKTKLNKQIKELRIRIKV